MAIPENLFYARFAQKPNRGQIFKQLSRQPKARLVFFQKTSLETKIAYPSISLVQASLMTVLTLCCISVIFHFQLVFSVQIGDVATTLLNN